MIKWEISSFLKSILREPRVQASFVSREGRRRAVFPVPHQKLLSHTELLQLISVSIEMQAGIKVESGKEAFHLVTEPLPTFAV